MNKYSQNWIENYVRGKKYSHDSSPPFKEKEKGSEGRSPLGGQWREKERVPMLRGQWKEKEKVPMLRGQWNVLSLVANGRWKKNPFHLFPFSPQPILLKASNFPSDLKVYFTMVPGHYSRISFLSLIYKLRLCISMQPVLRLLLLIWFWLKIRLFPPLKIMALRMVTSYEPQAA